MYVYKQFSQTLYKEIATRDGSFQNARRAGWVVEKGAGVEEDENRSACAVVATQSPADFVLEQAFFDGMDALPVGLAVFNASDLLVLGNRAFREMLPDDAELYDFGMLFPDVARRTAIEVYGVAEEEVNAWLEARLAYRRNPVGHFDQQLKDGRWFRIQESRTSDMGTVTNWTDITDLKRQEQVSERYADELMITNAQLGEFAHAASHDLKEPLRKIEVFGNRLSEKCGEDLDENGTRYLDRILNASSRMQRLIDALLNFSRSANVENTFEPIDLNDVIEETRVNLEVQIGESNARINTAVLPTIVGNFDQLARLFQNVLSNAIKYVAPDTQPVIEIEVISDTDTHIAITIRDNGIGFDQSDADKIFIPFQRLHGRSGQYEGSGIGLASCCKIVQQHGGLICADSAKGEGSTFTITLAKDARIPSSNLSNVG